MRAERRAMIALMAVFALLVQALVPTLASAAPLSGPDMVICTQAGLQKAPAGDPGQAPADHACKHCLRPAPATSPPPLVGVQPVVYAVTRAEAPATPRSPRPPARAPPRPPGQGPPASDA